MKSIKGFTLVEVLVAMFILLIGVTGAFALIFFTTSSVVNTRLELEAYYLIQEGMELTRAQRDSNFIDIARGGGATWDSGLAATCSAGCEVDYNDAVLVSLAGSPRKFFKTGGFYSYDAGVSTTFTRVITVDNTLPGKLQVRVEVGWEEHGRPHSLNAITELRNWAN